MCAPWPFVRPPIAVLVHPGVPLRLPSFSPSFYLPPSLPPSSPALLLHLALFFCLFVCYSSTGSLVFHSLRLPAGSCVTLSMLMLLYSALNTGPRRVEAERDIAGRREERGGCEAAAAAGDHSEEVRQCCCVNYLAVTGTLTVL